MGGFFLGIYRTPWSFNPQIQGGSGQFSHQPSLGMVAGWDVPAQYHRVKPDFIYLGKRKIPQASRMGWAPQLHPRKAQGEIVG